MKTQKVLAIGYPRSARQEIMNYMEIKEYQQLSKRTMSSCENPTLDQIHMVLGLQTEVAELADAYKKHIAYGKDLDLTNIKEEIGDTMFYIVNMCSLFNWDLRDIMSTNIEKLKARYPQKFTNDLANNRNLEVERTILEKTNK